MTGMERQKPEVLLVTEQTHDFGIIVRALVGTAYRGVVSRFDLKSVLRMMQYGNTSVIVGKVEETDRDGRCYNIKRQRDYPTPDDSPDALPDIWADWHWTGAPLMDNSPEDCRLDISLKVVLTELQRSGSMNKQTLLEHLALIMELARWDVSRETQQQLSQTRRLVSRHTDPDIRSLAPRLCRTLTAMGSGKRTRLFQEQYLPMLCESEAAKRMYRQWCTIHKAGTERREAVGANHHEAAGRHRGMPDPVAADLCYQKDQFGALMHRLLYLGVPQRKLLMLLSAIVLRRQLRKQLGLDEEERAMPTKEERQAGAATGSHLQRQHRQRARVSLADEGPEANRHHAHREPLGQGEAHQLHPLPTSALDGAPRGGHLQADGIELEHAALNVRRGWRLRLGQGSQEHSVEGNLPFWHACGR